MGRRGTPRSPRSTSPPRGAASCPGARRAGGSATPRAGGSAPSTTGGRSGRPGRGGEGAGGWAQAQSDEEQGGEDGAHGAPFLRGHRFTPGKDSTSGDVGGPPRRPPTRRSVPGFTPGPPLVIVTRTGTPWNPPCSRCPTPSPASVCSSPAAPALWARSPSPCSSTATARCWARSTCWCARAAPPPPSARFFDKVVPSEPFQPLRDHYGDAEARWRSSASKCEVLDGDITDPLARAVRRAAARRSPARWTSSSTAPGLVSFNPSLEVGLNVNTHGVQQRRRAVPGAGRPAGAHVHRLRGGQPQRAGLRGRGGRRLLPPQGRAGRARLLAGAGADGRGAHGRRLREQADDKALTSDLPRSRRWSGWRRRAATPRTRRRCGWRWAASASCGSPHEADRGRHGARRALGLAQHVHVHQVAWASRSSPARRTCATPSSGRPSWRARCAIPFPGWNEGFTTSAPLAFAGIKGQRGIPAGEQHHPGHHPGGPGGRRRSSPSPRRRSRTPERRVYQLASGDSNPFYAAALGRAGGPVPAPALPRARRPATRSSNDVLSRASSRSPSRKRSVRGPLARRCSPRARGCSSRRIEEVTARAGARRASRPCSSAREETAGRRGGAGRLALAGSIELFLPFLWENRYVFRCDNTRSRLRAHARRRTGADPLGPGGHRLARPTSSRCTCPAWRSGCSPAWRRRREKRKVIPAHRDLLELFEAAVHAYRHRVAFRMVADEKRGALHLRRGAPLRRARGQLPPAARA